MHLHGRRRTRFMLFLLIFLNNLCVPMGDELRLLRQASPRLPTLDPEPILESGDELLSTSIYVTSEQLGLNPVIIQGMKFLISQETKTKMQDWYLRGSSVEDISQGLFLVLLEVVLPAEQLESVDKSVRSYIGSGALAESFANQGVRGIEFRIAEKEQVGSVGVTKPKPSPLPVPSASPSPTALNDMNINISELVDVLPILEADMQYSRGIDIYVRSPTIFFPVKLGEAIKWEVAGETGTTPENDLPINWFMPDFYAINQTLGQYIATFVYYGNVSSVGEVVERAERYVGSQNLTRALLDRNARDVNISLLPKLRLPMAETVPSPSAGFSEVVMLFRISAPISGVSPELIATVKEGGGRMTTAKESEWKLKVVEQESENGPFMADFSVATMVGTEVESVRNITHLVRGRALNVALWNIGFTDVRIFLRPRLTTFGQGQSGSGGSAIASTAGTVTASVVGMLIVVVIAAGILCLLPRGDHAFGSSRSQATAVGYNSEGKRRWQVWR